MAQQIFDKHWPLGKNGANELIPGAAILQTRDGKDEPITLAASFQIGESGLFLPTSKDNPLEVRVRQLEAELQQLRQLLQNGDAQVTLTGRLTEIRSAGVIAGGSTTPDTRGSANFKDSIGALARVVHFDVKEPVWLHQLAFIQHVSMESQRNVVHRLYIYDSNDNAIWLPVMNSNNAFTHQYLRMSSFINDDHTVRITEAYPWKLLPPVEWLTNQYTAGLVFTAVPLPCPHGFRFESYNPDPENAALYRFQGMAYYTRM